MRTKKKKFRLRDSSVAKFIVPGAKDKRLKPKLVIPAQTITSRHRALMLSNSIAKYLAIRSA